MRMIVDRDEQLKWLRMAARSIADKGHGGAGPDDLVDDWLTRRAADYKRRTGHKDQPFPWAFAPRDREMLIECVAIELNRKEVEVSYIEDAETYEELYPGGDFQPEPFKISITRLED